MGPTNPGLTIGGQEDAHDLHSRHGLGAFSHGGVASAKKRCAMEKLCFSGSPKTINLMVVIGKGHYSSREIPWSHLHLNEIPWSHKNYKTKATTKTTLWFSGFWGSLAPHFGGKYIIPGSLAPSISQVENTIQGFKAIGS